MTAKMLIRNKKNLFIRREATHYLFGISARNAYVTLRLDLCSGVDVADGLGIRVHRLQLAQLGSGDHVSHGASGRRIGNQNFF